MMLQPPRLDHYVERKLVTGGSIHSFHRNVPAGTLMRMFQPEHIAKNIGTRASWLWTYRNSETCVPRGTSEPVTGSGVYGLQYRSRPASNRHKRSAWNTTVKSLVNTDSNRLVPVDL